MTPLPASLLRFPSPQRERLLRTHLAQRLAGMLDVAPDDLLAGGTLPADPGEAARLGERLAADLGLPLPALAGLNLDGLTSSVLEAHAAAASRPVPRALSQAELGMWVLDRLATGSPVCNVPVVLRFRGPLDDRALVSSLEELVRRHEALRTTFPARDGRPSAVVDPDASLTVRRLDLSEVAPDAREEEALERARHEVQRRFDLAGGPLVRALMIRLAPEDHILALTCHHIVVDGASFLVVCRELSACYEALRRGRAPDLPPLPTGSPARSSAPSERDLEYFRRKLAGVPSDLALPTDFPRPATPSGRGGWERRRFPPAVIEGLRALCGSESATPFMGMLAAFQLLLSRLSGQEEFVVGVPAAHRPGGTKDRVGCYLRMLPIASSVSGALSFRQVLRQVRSDTLEAHEHAEVPFDRLLETLSEGQEPGRNPLYQVMLVLEHDPIPELRLRDVSVTRLPVHAHTSQCDLTLMMEERDGGVDANLEFATELFDPGSAARMLLQLETLLTAAVEEPDRPCDTLSLARAEPLVVRTGEADRNGALRERAASGREPVVLLGDATPVEAARLDELFSARARSEPDRVALAGPAGEVGYGELDARSDELARRLRTAGVLPGSRIALPIARSPELIVGMLGALKAGCAYVPFDMDQPARRRAFLEAACHASVHATTSALEIRPGDGPPPEGSDGADPLRDPAYVLFTSGSTGRPKGVVVAHAPIVHLARSMAASLELTPDDRVLQFCSPAFDASVLEIHPTLLRGAAVVLRSDAMPASARHFWEECRIRGVTIAVLPVAFFHRLTAEASTLDPPASLRALVVGGESLLPRCLARWHRRVGGRIRVFNQYGATETAVVATMCEAVPGARRVSIGRPVPDAEVMVLDAAGDACPVGVAGEITVGGPGLALGYLDMPGLTAERFVEAPSAPAAGGRRYRTGDMGRITSECTLEFLGRRDGQLKIRGFRVEPGEVEAALLGHPDVIEAAVDVREVAGEKHLVAYVVGPGIVDVPDLQGFLRGDLPRHMVPSRFVPLETIPRLPGGKVDRRSLPDPSGDRPVHAAAPPRDETETALVRIWEEVLGVQPVGVHDDVYQLGAHSLVVVHALEKMEGIFGRALSPPDLYGAPTVEEQARLLRGEPRDPSERGLVKLAEGGDAIPLFCVDPSGPGARSFLPLAERLDGRGVWGLPLGGTAASVEEVARDLVRAVRATRPDGPWVLCGWSLGGVVAFEAARQLEEEGGDVVVGLIDTRTPAWYARNGEIPRAAVIAGVARQMGLEPPFPGDVDELVARVRAAGRTGEGGGEAEIQRLMDGLEAMRALVAAYRPGPFSGRTILVRAHDPPRPEGDDYAWSPVAPSLETLTLPGDHYSLMTEPHVATLARELDARIA